MNSFVRRSLFVFLSVVFTVSLLSSLNASTLPPLAGTYKITANTSSGSSARLTVELSFINGGTSSVTISGVSARTSSSPGAMVTATTNLTVHAHSKSQVSLQFVVPQTDLAAWTTGGQQQFLVTLQVSGGKPTVATVLLLRTKD